MFGACSVHVRCMFGGDPLLRRSCDGGGSLKGRWMNGVGALDVQSRQKKHRICIGSAPDQVRKVS